jgi:hypothetical protein
MQNGRPNPPDQALHYVLVILDSCRFDSFMEAAPPTLLKLGPVERRWSYASWTSPSHFNLLMGLLPHQSPRNVYASDAYRQGFAKYQERLGISDVGFLNMLPSLFLPTFLRNSLGYACHARTSMPVLNPATPLNRDFDTFQLMPTHNDMAAMLPTLHFGDRPTFHILNIGETHYPYATPDEAPEQWPRIHGVNGVFRTLDAQLREGHAVHGESALKVFDEDKLLQLKARQVDAVRYLDGVFEQLFDLLPDRSYVTVTADHGELFGEGGYFGHGPIQHDKVFEVPFLEGRLR